MSILLLILSAVVIYLSSEFFVNGVEWVGRKAGVADTAVGTILAAFGTALPESVVTLVAVAFSRGSVEGQQIGVGAALGGPLVLSTLAYSVVGVMMWVTLKDKKRRNQPIDGKKLSRDQGWFLVIFAAKVALGLIAFHWKPWVGLLFLAAYAIYLWKEMRLDGGIAGEPLEPLRIKPRVEDPALGWAMLQTGLSLSVTFGASQIFVKQLEHLAPVLGIPAGLAAVLLSPIATELPETLNAVIWVRQGKHGLALGNISGSMMIQATIPSALGIVFTPWMLDAPLIWAAVITFISVLGLLILFKKNAVTPKRLAAFGIIYGVFIASLAIGLTHPEALLGQKNSEGRPLRQLAAHFN